MTPETRAILRATPASTGGQASRSHTIADAAEVDVAAAQVALDTLVGQGLVEREGTVRAMVFCRTALGDRVAREGGR